MDHVIYFNPIISTPNFYVDVATSKQRVHDKLNLNHGVGGSHLASESKAV